MAGLLKSRESLAMDVRTPFLPPLPPSTPPMIRRRPHSVPSHPPKNNHNHQQLPRIFCSQRKRNHQSKATINTFSSVQSYHSKNDYAITVLSRPTSTVSRHTISPICDHGRPPHSPKTARNKPQTNRFSFVHLQRD